MFNETSAVTNGVDVTVTIASIELDEFRGLENGPLNEAEGVNTSNPQISSMDIFSDETNVLHEESLLADWDYFVV